MKVTPISCGPAVNESERKAIDQLKTRLISLPGEAEWFLLTNLTFSATCRFQSDEIDIVAIGPPGVRVIEVKHWSAAWVDKHPSEVEQAAELITNKARRVGTTLRRKVPNLGRVDGVFLVTETLSKVRQLENRPPVRGVPFHTFKTWETALGVDSTNTLSSQQLKILSCELEPKSRVAIDGALKRLAGYTHLELETPPNQRFHRIYKGKHSSRQDRVVLHLYDLSVSSGANTMSRARREFDALHRLQRHHWAPRIVDSFREAPGYAGELYFFTVADPAAPCLEERASDDSWDMETRLGFARSAVRALQAMHEAGADDQPMVHRNLTPRTVFVKHDNSPVLAGFEHTRIPAEDTVVPADSPVNGWDDAVAPELRSQGLGAADYRSDVYSLCACLATLFSNHAGADRVGILETLAKGMENDPNERSTLSDLDTAFSRWLGESVPAPPPPPARFWTEDQVVPFRDRHYRIISRLGSGAVGTAFKVVKIDHATKEELGAYVAKVVHDENTGRRVLRAYELAHSHLHHSALSTIFEVAPEWVENGFVALMSWVEGEPLSEYAGLVPVLAEDWQEESTEALVLRWLRTACEALDVLHRNGLAHGDVSPRNVIVSNDKLVVTDYDFVDKIGEPVSTPGTLPYCPPLPPEGRLVAPSDDVYALAASFFHVLFEREPFRYDDIQAKQRGLNWKGLARDEYPALAAFMDQATSADSQRRFASAAAALAVLNPPPRAETPVQDDTRDELAGSGGGEAGGADDERRENEIPWLKNLLQSYPGSRWGNRETRGLDTDFAAETYVETELERALYDDIQKRRVQLVILCGNAGDGKTALLQHLAKRLGFGSHQSGERVLERQMDDGLTVRMNLDGSASWRGRSANDLLDEFLGPFQHGRPAAHTVHLLAINDGRLLEWMEAVEEVRNETPLTKELYQLLGEQTPSPGSHIRFISLNQRSLTGSVNSDQAPQIETGFLERLMDSLYGGKRAREIWAPCQTCSAQDRCEVRRAMKVFGPEGVPGLVAEEHRSRARQRLFDALQAVHLRGKTHITVRELRAALVYILFGVHYCSDYHGRRRCPVALLGPRLLAGVTGTPGRGIAGTGFP